MSHKFALALALMVGCAAGAATSSFVVPPLHAQAAATRWEHNCGHDASKAQLDEAGAQGWELVSVSVLHRTNTLQDSTLFYCFKRPVR